MFYFASSVPLQFKCTERKSDNLKFESLIKTSKENRRENGQQEENFRERRS